MQAATPGATTRRQSCAGSASRARVSTGRSAPSPGGDCLERFVERFRASTPKMARKAQAKLTQIGRLEKERGQAKTEIELLTRRGRRLGFEFLKPPRSGRTVIEGNGVQITIGERTLLDEVGIASEDGRHVRL